LLDSVRRINEIANDLLTRSKTVFKQVVPSVSRISIFDLYGLVDEVLVEKSIQSKGKRITFDLSTSSKDEQIFIVIEPVRLKRIMSNLIGNSVEALNEQGQVEVRIEGGTKELVLEIRDNGRGIPMEILPKLMKEGFTFGKSNGNGLGLFSAKRDVESWGGSIGITSAVDRGTTVAIRLPLSN